MLELMLNFNSGDGQLLMQAAGRIKLYPTQQFAGRDVSIPRCLVERRIAIRVHAANKKFQITPKHHHCLNSGIGIAADIAT